MLELEAVSRIVDGNPLLSQVSLAVQDGELVSVLGPTGSGKTTLLRLILGLDAPDSGTVRFAGQTLAASGRNLVPPERRGFALVFESTALLPGSVERNVQVGARRGDDPGRRRLEALLDLLRLQGLRGRQARGLSGGEQQRVALARALYVQPRLLLLDEPFRNLDRPLRDDLIPALQAYLRAQGVAAVLVSHDRDEVFAFSQRIFVLREGRLVGSGTPQQLYRHPGSEDDARLLGESNRLPRSLAVELLGLPTSGSGWVRVRPEDLAASAEPPFNATLRACRFHGFYQALEFEVAGDATVQVKALGGDEYRAGERYRLWLKDPSQVEALDDAEPEAR